MLIQLSLTSKISENRAIDNQEIAADFGTRLDKLNFNSSVKVKLLENDDLQLVHRYNAEA